MDNDNQLPVLQASPLPKECYTTLQDFVNDLVKSLHIPSDTISIVKGADGLSGDRGTKGDRGPKGDKGDRGDGSVLLHQEIPIPLNGRFVELPKFPGWEYATYTLRHSKTIDTAQLTDYSGFDPEGNQIAVSVVLEVTNAGIPTGNIRCYLLDTSGAGGGAPTADFILQISQVV